MTTARIEKISSTALSLRLALIYRRDGGGTREHWTPSPSRDKLEHGRMSTAESVTSAFVTARTALLYSAFLIGAVLAGCSGQKADTPAEHLAKADTALQKGELIEAEKRYREVLRLTPNDATAQRELGILYF